MGTSHFSLPTSTEVLRGVIEHFIVYLSLSQRVPINGNDSEAPKLF